MPWDELGANQLAYRLCLKVVFLSWILLKNMIPTSIEKNVGTPCATYTINLFVNHLHFLHLDVNIVCKCCICCCG
jgi:hypothetical protein